MISEYISSVGFELEGGIKNGKVRSFETWAKQKFGDRFASSYGDSGDPSVRVPSGYTNREYTFWSTDINEIKEFLDMAYGEAGYVTGDGSGFHIHIKSNPRKLSTEELAALAVFEPIFNEFVAKYQAKYRGIPKYINRLRSNYAGETMNEATLRNQLASPYHSPNTRYTAYNLNSINKHGTIENRVFPANETAGEALSAVKTAVEIWDGILANALTERKKVFKEITDTRAEDENLRISAQAKNRLRNRGVDIEIEE